MLKFITTENADGVEEIFIFPIAINHDCMMEAIGYVRSQTYGNWERVRRKPIAAGFVKGGTRCFGHSETLKLSSRPEDTELLKRLMVV